MKLQLNFISFNWSLPSIYALQHTGVSSLPHVASKSQKTPGSKRLRNSLMSLSKFGPSQDLNPDPADCRVHMSSTLWFLSVRNLCFSQNTAKANHSFIHPLIHFLIQEVFHSSISMCFLNPYCVLGTVCLEGVERAMRTFSSHDKELQSMLQSSPFGEAEKLGLCLGSATC